MLQARVESETGVIIIEPRGPLHKEDFAGLSRIVDPYLETQGKLQGIMIKAEKFPGWESFGAFTEHIRFVRDHHRRIEKVALVTDSPIGRLGQALVGHFVNAEVRCFAFTAADEANRWLTAS